MPRGRGEPLPGRFKNEDTHHKTEALQPGIV